MFERFTVDARAALTEANELANLTNARLTEPVHLALAALRTGETPGRKLLISLGVDKRIAERLDVVHKAVGSPRSSHYVPLAPASKKVLELALREALGRGDYHIGSDHIVMGLIRHGSETVIERLGKPIPLAEAQRVWTALRVAGSGSSGADIPDSSPPSVETKPQKKTQRVARTLLKGRGCSSGTTAGSPQAPTWTMKDRRSLCQPISLCSSSARRDETSGRTTPTRRGCCRSYRVRPCDWRPDPLSGLLQLERNAEPVTRWASRDEAWLTVVEGITSV